jgi:UDP-sulfoquinovose synthase
VEVADATNYRQLLKIIDHYRPSSVLHYGEQPSAPFSMLDRSRAVQTQINNISGTLNLAFAVKAVDPSIHIIKLGTMGEYGQPNIDIEEGWLNVEHNGRSQRFLYPKSAGSFYHLSKVHDSNNLEFVCRVWNLSVTDLNQGIVYGNETPHTSLHPDLITSFHYDDVFGTVINRFMLQASNDIPLTLYGSGEKIRAMLNINDTLRCVQLAAENPAQSGEFRVFNQFTEQVSLDTLINKVKDIFVDLGKNVSIQSISNPRIESEAHYFSAVNSGLIALGLEPTLLDDVLPEMARSLINSDSNINSDHIQPRIKWNY